MYIENKSCGNGLTGPARIGRVLFSKTGKTQGLFGFLAAVSAIRINVRVGFCRTEQLVKDLTVMH